ncbi:MAG: hypothetical protein JNK82_19420 [Myxococcaceae bacterium]|nr:hypothetical protein [Myxococcaceae bacterium]
MHTSRLAVPCLVAFSACFTPPQETELGGNTGGGSATAGGGNIATAGGGNIATAGGGNIATAGGGNIATAGGGATAGGNTAGGGNVVVNPDGGALIDTLGMLPMADCFNPILPRECHDAGTCITFHQQGQQPQVVFQMNELPAGQSFNYTLGVTERGLLFVSSSAGQGGRLHLVAHGQPRVEVQTTAANQQLHAYGLHDSPGYGFWYRADISHGLTSVSQSLMLSTSDSAVFTNAFTAGFTARPFSRGTNYYAAVDDGVYSYYPAGGGRVATKQAPLSTPEDIVGIAGDDEGVVFVQCPQNRQGACRLFDARRFAPAVVPFASFTGLQGGGGGGAVSIAIAGGHIYVLGATRLYRVPRTGGAVEVVYRGEVFPAYGGTLASDSLKAIGNKLYLGSICEYDADAPGYGTVELDLATLQARWLNLDPAYPYVPYIAPYRGAEGQHLWRAVDGVYVVR